MVLVIRVFDHRLPCDPNIICQEYNPLWDALFWLITILCPYIYGLIQGFTKKSQELAESIDKLTAAISVVQILAGIGIRFYVVESQQNFLQPTILMIVTMMICFIGSRARFIYVLGSNIVIMGVWVIISLVTLSITPIIIPLNSGGAYFIGLACMLISSIIVVFASYQNEQLSRQMFLMEKDMKKNNAKLKNQLNMLAKSYNQQAVKSLDSPLERSMMIIRSVMADPSLISRHLLALGQVTSLLASSNLLTPDFEGTVSDTMDNEQQVLIALTIGLAFLGNSSS
jgi:hypothetical protein